MTFESFGHIIIGETLWDYYYSSILRLAWDYDHTSILMLAERHNKFLKYFGKHFDKGLSKILQKDFRNEL
jgi:hypothetical protein